MDSHERSIWSDSTWQYRVDHTAPEVSTAERRALAQAAGKDREFRGTRKDPSSRMDRLIAAIVSFVPIVSLVLVFSQPWSRITVCIYNQSDHPLLVLMLMDGEEVAREEIGYVSDIDFEMTDHVNMGSHTVDVQTILSPDHLTYLGVAPFSQKIVSVQLTE